MSNNIAYFCLEIGLESEMKTYAGGLGVLAGDTLKSAADMGVQMCGVTLLYKQGYFKQVIDENGDQFAKPDTWNYSNKLWLRMPAVKVNIGSQEVWVQAWQYDIKGLKGNIPVIFLDVDLEHNSEEIRLLSYNLYDSDRQIRLRQELLLGLGGLQVLDKMGYTDFQQYHLNESHAAFTLLSLIQKHGISDLSKKVTFTTHTPIPAGHEIFPIEMLKKELGEFFKYIPAILLNGEVENLNLSELCLEVAHFSNAVSKKHCEVTKEMFPNAHIQYITNGVYHSSWISDPVAKMLDKYISDWRAEPAHLRMADIIPPEEILDAHRQSKLKLIEFLYDYSKDEIDPDIFTIGFARRAVGYKRSNMIFSDRERLNEIASKYGRLQLIFSGKAHPNDTEGQKVVEEIIKVSQDLGDFLQVIYVPDYSMNISKNLVSGVDLWLNNPVVPQEASGTSGMKASLNGIPNLSTLDGWWVEGCTEGVTGWSIGGGCQGLDCLSDELEDLYTKLDKTILPMYYNDKTAWARIQRNCIGLNGSYFNTHRMLQEYSMKAYIND